MTERQATGTEWTNPQMEIIFFPAEEIVRTSPAIDVKDEGSGDACDARDWF